MNLDDNDDRKAGAYILRYADQDMDDEVFSGYGAEAAAHRRFEIQSSAWSLNLYEAIRQSPGNLERLYSNSLLDSEAEKIKRRLDRHLIANLDTLSEIILADPDPYILARQIIDVIAKGEFVKAGMMMLILTEMCEDLNVLPVDIIAGMVKSDHPEETTNKNEEELNLKVRYALISNSFLKLYEEKRRSV